MKHNHSPILHAVRRVFGYHSSVAERERRERQLEDRVVDYFSGAGIPVRRQVYCGEAGVADVVTPDTIFELKDVLSCRRVLHQALGQLLLYRSHLGHHWKTAIICNSSKKPQLSHLARLAGVEVYVWPDGGSFIMADPPYRRPIR